MTRIIVIARPPPYRHREATPFVIARPQAVAVHAALVWVIVTP